jgi:hypothetical protein
MLVEEPTTELRMGVGGGEEEKKDSSDTRHPRNGNSETVLIFAYVFVPDGGILLNIVGKERDTFLGVEVEDFDVERAEPVDAALESTAFADDDASKIKLANQAAAIPAGS